MSQTKLSLMGSSVRGYKKKSSYHVTPTLACKSKKISLLKMYIAGKTLRHSSYRRLFLLVNSQDLRVLRWSENLPVQEITSSMMDLTREPGKQTGTFYVPT